MASIGHSVVRSSFIAFCVFAAIILLLLVIAIWKRKSWLGRIRLFTVIPLALGGAMATYQFNDIRGFSFRDQHQSRAATLRSVYGLSSITMDFAAAWSIIVVMCLGRLKSASKSASAAITTLDRKHSSAYFYLVMVDIAVLGCLLASVIIAGSFIPLEIRQCSSSNSISSLMIALLAKGTHEFPGANTGACDKGFWIQSMTGISAALTLCQIVLQLPLVNLPNGFRFAIFFAIRLFRRPRSTHRDIELGGCDMSLICSKASNLEEEVAHLVEKHPHYADLVAAAKELRGIASPKHLDLFARRACVGKTKSQCWACEGIICDDCTTSRFNVPAPRTTNHVVHCVAMCTTCYLVKASSQPAAFSATLNPTDLSHQHQGCKFEEKKRAMTGEVSLCQTCAKRTPESISASRETREERMLALALKRVVLCAECEKPIPKRKRRWWICSLGDHDCHWGGHEVSR
ncbi:hypothetical protein V8F06_008720 [Rhypophila decipiens]